MVYCKECAARSKLLREAAFEGRLAAAMGHAVKGAAEIIGLKEKTGVAELGAAQAPEAEPEDQWPAAGLDTSEAGPEAEGETP